MVKACPGPFQASVAQSARPRWPLIATALLLAATIYGFSGRLLPWNVSASAPFSFPDAWVDKDTKMCPQAKPLAPQRNSVLWENITALHSSDTFLKRAIAQLSNAVQIPTETFDSMGPVGEDARWESRGPFVDHLEKAFPLVHSTLKLERVNTYGLLYIWEGSVSSLKPLLLMGHYDVVPVAASSVDQWTHPPYSGHYDGENIWGRGSSDDKSGVIGMMTAIEVLLEHNFTPTRTVILSFGFDEELADQRYGARHLASTLLERLGPDSIAMIVDEGSGYSENYGAIFAVPGIAEKGSANVEVEVKTPGGHSSVPPKHTSIGILAAIIVHLELNAPKPELAVDTPLFEMAQCFAAHGPGMPRDVKRSIRRAARRGSAKHLKKAAEYLLQDTMLKALVGTTLAVDIVNGGVKSNALPEQAMVGITASMNIRPHYSQTVVNHLNATLSRDSSLVMDLAEKYNLSVTAYGEPLTPADTPTYGSVLIHAPIHLEPAPISPIDANPFQILAGSIRTARQTGSTKDDVYVAPGMMTGNTDTKYYWPLSKHIFRYGHRNMIGRGMGGIHTVNEHVPAASFVEIITYLTVLILNVDETTL
ncbi:carboxypeptidase S [Favolaschia claudopus]|uniref:Carboxypeptidase S n=1 Tax=Favolaschia claudopus TaxID=2862362 RepID=A0AAW0B4U0_9AGAR